MLGKRASRALLQSMYSVESRPFAPQKSRSSSSERNSGIGLSCFLKGLPFLAVHRRYAHVIDHEVESEMVVCAVHRRAMVAATRSFNRFCLCSAATIAKKFSLLGLPRGASMR